MTTTRSGAVATLCVLMMMSATAVAEDDEVEKDTEEEPPGDDADGRKKSKKKERAKEPEPADTDDAPARGGVATASVSSGELVEVGAPKGRMTLPGGKVLVNVIAESNLAKGAAGKPVSVAPDLWFGIADRLTFGIVHSGRAATGFLTGFGTGLCFRGGGDMGACATGLGDVYTFAGAEARIGLTEGAFALAFVAGGQARAFEPDLVVSAKTGFVARLHGRRVALELAPVAFIGVTQRKVMGVEFNRDAMAIPVTLFLRLAPSFSIALQSGATFTLKKAGETYRVPAAAGLAWWVTKHFSIDVAFGLAAVLDKDDMTKAFDNRSATLGVGYAL